MRRVQMYIPDELHDLLRKESARLEIGVSELVRRLALRYFGQKGKRKK